MQQINTSGWFFFARCVKIPTLHIRKKNTTKGCAYAILNSPVCVVIFTSTKIIDTIQQQGRGNLFSMVLLETKAKPQRYIFFCCFQNALLEKSI
jgi:hypothetical protein